jgi:hypothetical protein
MENDMNVILFYIWKIFHLRGDDDIVESAYSGEHPTVGIYAMLCSQEQATGGGVH